MLLLKAFLEGRSLGVVDPPEGCPGVKGWLASYSQCNLSPLALWLFLEITMMKCVLSRSCAIVMCVCLLSNSSPLGKFISMFLVQDVLKQHSQSLDTGSTWSRKYPLSWLWCMKETLKMV